MNYWSDHIFLVYRNYNILKVIARLMSQKQIQKRILNCPLVQCLILNTFNQTVVNITLRVLIFFLSCDLCQNAT